MNTNRNYTANGLNQYTATGTTTPTYDPKGNLTSAGSYTYSFNAENQLATLVNGGVTHYYYVDALHRLVFDNGDNARFEYDGSSLAAEYSTGGALLRRYVSGPGDDEPLVWYEGSGTSDKRYLVADERGSILWVQNASGSTIATNSYDEYGIPGASNVGRFQYTGQQWIPDIGMYYYKARFYSPTLGRFLQTDPIGYGDGPNWYNYVQSDPVNATDPMGLGTVCTTGQGCYDDGDPGIDLRGPRYNPNDPFYAAGGQGAVYRPGGGVPSIPLRLPPIRLPKLPQNKLCPRNAFTNALGKLNALTETAAGLIAGYVGGFAQELAGGPAVHVGMGNNAIQFTGFTGGQAAGFTLGNVQLYGASSGPDSGRLRYDGGVATGNMGSHEEGHTYQFQSYTPAYMLYQFVKSKVGNNSKNAMENEADNYADKGPRC